MCAYIRLHVSLHVRMHVHAYVQHVKVSEVFFETEGVDALVGNIIKGEKCLTVNDL